MKVQFPGLWGLEFEIRNWAFEIFNITIYWYGIIIALSFLVGVLLAVRSSKKFGIDPDTILDIILFAAPAAIVGARLYYVLLSWDQYKDDLLQIFNTRNGGLALYGGLIGAILVVLLYARIKKLPFLHMMDFAAPYIILAQGIGRWGNFFNQEAFGYKTTLPWRMNGTVPNEYLIGLKENLDLTKWGVHPTFLYEFLWDIVVFLFLLFYRRKKKYDGEVLFLYAIFYGIGRFFIEGLRTDSLMLGSVRFSQLLSLLLALVFAILFVYRRYRKAKLSDEEQVSLGQSEYGELLMKMKEEEQKEEMEKQEEYKEEQEEQEELKEDKGEQEEEHEEEQSKEQKEESKEDTNDSMSLDINIEAEAERDFAEDNINEKEGKARKAAHDTTEETES